MPEPSPRPFGLLTALALALPVVVGVASAVLGGNEAPASAPPDALSPRERDVKLALRARKALQGNKNLADLNLGVRSQESVLILWGPVPSAALEKEAIALLRQVEGVHQVRSELYIAAENRSDPIVMPSESGRPTQSQSASPDTATGSIQSVPGRPAHPAPGVASPDAQGQLTGRVPAIALPPSGRTSTAPAPADAPAASTPPPVESQPSTVRLLAPVVSPDSAPAARAPAPAMPATESLMQAVQRIRQSESRFRLVDATVEGAVVYVGGDASGDAIMGLARAVSNLPGIERVVIRTGSRPR
jgi:osmotically-inducible protein OsmY